MPIPRLRTALFAALLALSASAASAPAAVLEEVVVVRGDEDWAEIERADGFRYRLELRQDCRIAHALVGRRVLIHSPQAFLGPESRLLLPEFMHSCRIWEADSLGRGRVVAAPEEPSVGLSAVREALELVGQHAGPPGNRRWSPEAAQAFVRYRESRKLDNTTLGLRKALTALALDAMRGRQVTGTGLRVSQAITDHADAIIAYLAGSGGPAGSRLCTDPTWIRSIAEDGASIVLGDASGWAIDEQHRAAVTQWADTDPVTPCSGHLVNVRNGEMAKATRLQ